MVLENYVKEKRKGVVNVRQVLKEKNTELN